MIFVGITNGYQISALINLPCEVETFSVEENPASYDSNLSLMVLKDDQMVCLGNTSCVLSKFLVIYLVLRLIKFTL